MGMVRVVRNIALAGQVLFVVCACMPGMEQPAKGAMFLISFWFFGMNIGSCLFGMWRRMKGAEQR